VAPALMVALGYYLAARVGFAFTLQPHPTSTLWPPNAMLLAVLLLAPTRAWWWLLAAALPGHLLAELQSGVPAAMVLGWYLSNCCEALIGASLMRAFAPAPFRLDSLRNVGVFLGCGALAAPLLSSFIDAALVRLIGWGESGYWDLVSNRVYSNTLAALTVAPLILTWSNVDLSQLRRVRVARAAEAAALFIGLLAVSFVVFGLPAVNANAMPALFYAPLHFLLWAAVRLGPAGTASALAAMAVMTIWGGVHGLVPFSGQPPEETAREMQLFLSAVAVPMLLLAVVLDQGARVERDAFEQRQQLTHLSRVATLGELSGGIAHELNQPLTAILSNAQAARQFIANKTGDPALLAEILEDIIVADQRASEVIRRLHAMFKRGETQFEKLDVNVIVQDVLGIVQGDLVTRSVAVVAQLGAGLPQVYGDRVELQQVVLNLVMNACEAMAATASEERRVTISTATVAGAVQITVSDRGSGFTSDQHARLFEPFYTTKPRGLGLGLSISRAIVLTHGGRVWCAPRAGGGGDLPYRVAAQRMIATGDGIGPWSTLDLGPITRRRATCSNRASCRPMSRSSMMRSRSARR
jgi:signal transduction histidine kinase